MENMMETKKCPFCFEEIKFEAVKCKHCGEFLKPDVESDNTNSKVWICKKCKEEVDNEYDTCWNCGSDKSGYVDNETTTEFNKNKSINRNLNDNKIDKNKNHGVPALLSLFLPGLGQLIKGHILKAIFIWIIGAIIACFLFWTFIVPFGFWAWNVYDAYNYNSN
jgi:TM2 domain-containing membrane protein YozV